MVGRTTIVRVLAGREPGTVHGQVVRPRQLATCRVTRRHRFNVPMDDPPLGGLVPKDRRDVQDMGLGDSSADGSHRVLVPDGPRSRA